LYPETFPFLKTCRLRIRASNSRITLTLPSGQPPPVLPPAAHDRAGVFWRLPNLTILCYEQASVSVVRVSTLFCTTSTGVLSFLRRWKRRLRSFRSLSGRIPGLRKEICLCKRKMRIHPQRGGLTTFPSAVRFSSSTRGASEPLRLQPFHSNASDIACTPSVLADHPHLSPHTYTKILRMVRYPPANQLYPNVPRVHITHCVPCPRPRTSIVSRRRSGRERRD